VHVGLVIILLLRGNILGPLRVCGVWCFFCGPLTMLPALWGLEYWGTCREQRCGKASSAALGQLLAVAAILHQVAQAVVPVLGTLVCFAALQKEASFLAVSTFVECSGFHIFLQDGGELCSTCTAVALQQNLTLIRAKPYILDGT
jgi:hypothetical protein